MKNSHEDVRGNEIRVLGNEQDTVLRVRVTTRRRGASSKSNNNSNKAHQGCSREEATGPVDQTPEEEPVVEVVEEEEPQRDLGYEGLKEEEEEEAPVEEYEKYY